MREVALNTQSKFGSEFETSSLTCYVSMQQGTVSVNYHMYISGNNVLFMCVYADQVAKLSWLKRKEYQYGVVVTAGLLGYGIARLRKR